jgi:hypothetical protein
LTLRNDINSTSYWFFSSYYSYIVINIKSIIDTEHKEIQWNKNNQNFNVYNGWQMIEIENVACIE